VAQGDEILGMKPLPNPPRRGGEPELAKLANFASFANFTLARICNPCHNANFAATDSRIKKQKMSESVAKGEARITNPRQWGGIINSARRRLCLVRIIKQILRLISKIPWKTKKRVAPPPVKLIAVPLIKRVALMCL